MRLDVVPGSDLVGLVRAAQSDSIVVVIAADLNPLASALARAAIEPLAIERAPTTRINAVLPGAAADPRDVEAAVAFLHAARSMTGQLLVVS